METVRRIEIYGRPLTPRQRRRVQHKGRARAVLRERQWASMKNLERAGGVAVDDLIKTRPFIVASAIQYPTERAVRDDLALNYGPLAMGEYRGIWRPPDSRETLHLFTDMDTDDLIEHGWRLISSALPGEAPWTPGTAEPCGRTDLPEDSEAICAECCQPAGNHPEWRRKHPPVSQ